MDEATIDRAAMGRLSKALAFVCGAELGAQSRGVLPEVGRAKAVAEEPADFPCGQAVVVSVDGKGEGYSVVLDQFLRENARAAPSGEENHPDLRISGRHGLGTRGKRW